MGWIEYEPSRSGRNDKTAMLWFSKQEWWLVFKVAHGHCAFTYGTVTTRMKGLGWKIVIV